MISLQTHYLGGGRHFPMWPEERRWEIADAYADRFLEQSPENTAGLLMKLHFTTALGKVDEASTLKARLREKGDQGELTVGEQQTLALYLEN